MTKTKLTFDIKINTAIEDMFSFDAFCHVPDAFQTKKKMFYFSTFF